MTRTIGIVLFRDFEDLDAIGPKEALTMMAKSTSGEWQVVLVSEDGEPVTSFLGTRYMVDHNYESCPQLDVILIPGGLGTRREMDNPKDIDFVQKQAKGCQYVTSVCTGALVLHAAGFLAGKRATTHWSALDALRTLGNVTVVDDERYVHDGNVITAAGVSAGIDMALYLISLLKGPEVAKSVQHMMEYYPRPPVFEVVV
ncbi:MAG: DJ-1/PfpI family protein [Chloroflexota bacterium]|nr:DJ-1/PfpI family protein [Chloroflexota bacterium]